MYLPTTAFLSLVLRVDRKRTSLYINGAHAVHADVNGHAGVYTTMGTGAVYISSTKIKINTVSLIKTEVVRMTHLRSIFYIRITRAPFSFRTMVGSHVEKVPSTFTSNIFSLQTGSNRRRSGLSIVLQGQW